MGGRGVPGATFIVHNYGIKRKRKSGGLYDVATVTHIVPLMTASAHIFWVIICSPDGAQLAPRAFRAQTNYGRMRLFPVSVLYS